MLRNLFFVTCFFIWTAAAGQQYPFVHYTPKDGLLSNRVRSIYQDSKGKLYFSTLGGLSLYDGARFINYTSENGLPNDIVNCIMEMGEDSVWIVPNVAKIQCLVKGKLKSVALSDPPPIIDNLVRDEKGTLYAASEQGLYIFQQNKFVKLPFIDVDGKDVSAYIDNIIPVGNFLLVVRDNTLLDIEERYVLYLYDKESKKIIAQSKKETIFTVAKAPDGRIWVSTEKNILSMDTLELKKGKIAFEELPGIYQKIIKTSGFNLIFFDQENNCWLTDRISFLKKVGNDGSVISFTTSSGLSTPDINQVFQDKEGIIWIATFSAGIDKLVNSNFSFTSDPFGLSAVNNISYSADKNQLLLYSYNKSRAVEIAENKSFRYYELQTPNEISELIETPKGLFGFSGNNIYKMMPSGNRLYPQPIFSDTIDNQLTAPVVDRYGNLVLCGKYYLTAVVDGKTISRKKINYFADRAALDTNGNVWIATRDNELILFETNPSDPANYLVQKINFKKELSGVLPRSLTIDRKNILWIGSRSNGLFAFKLENGILTRQFHLNSASGLSDNFVAYLTVDMDNNIWACSPSGLDRINVKDGVPVIENITKQNNIYQSVLKVVIDKNNTAWALLSNGLIKITPENRMTTDYAPKLVIASIKAGKDTIAEKTGTLLSYKQNNLSFYFSAPTYLDEKQVLYSYQLQGSGNDEWTEPTNNASVSFIDLPPRDYTLNIKVSFPSGRYPLQMIQYKFSIMPPWWQTWWFRTIAGLLMVGLLIMVIRFYYRRKLEKEKTVLEKKQAIEKERTRIATDMHDDLGAGLSRIKFLSETIGIKKQQQLPIEEDISKIREYSHDMIDKMGEIVWALNEKNDSLSDLLSYSRAYATEYLSLNGIRCIVEAPEQFPTGYISGEFRRSIYLTIKEALHNVVKHAQATTVEIKIEIKHNLVIEIKDNGVGFDRNTIRSFSNGLSNMKSRITGIGGGFDIINENGTRIRIKVPLSV